MAGLADAVWFLRCWRDFRPVSCCYYECCCFRLPKDANFGDLIQAFRRSGLHAVLSPKKEQFPLTTIKRSERVSLEVRGHGRMVAQQCLHVALLFKGQVSMSLKLVTDCYNILFFVAEEARPQNIMLFRVAKIAFLVDGGGRCRGLSLAVGIDA